MTTGLQYPLHCVAGGFAVVDGTDELEQSLRMVLLTYPGERVLRPDFGCRLRDFVFETVTPATQVWLADEVRGALRACEPRAEVDQVDVVPDQGIDGLVHLVIGYRPVDGGSQRELTVDLRTDRAGTAGGDD
ncbi:GPW/gp25 family protein [Kribbella sp. NPDC026611]|uniref:GPW/gp25 family protein n=1 Tax=Kribbella sp. NPDC026611 TaxID=3154911 RepID=UPI0033CA7034